MKYAMLIDVNRCSVCYSCQVACKDEFVGNVYPPYSYSQTDLQPSWIRVSEIEKGKYPHVKVYAVPGLCMQCEDAPCIKACPVHGCIYKTNTGVVIIDPAKCNGCRDCQKACPYEAISFNDDRNICQKCTLCQHRLQEGKEPACIDACPSGVFYLDEESKVKEMAQKRGARQMHPEYKTGPRIYYVGLPSVSLAGHMISGDNLMDVPGAVVTISDARTGATKTQKTNASGNFLAEELKKDNSYTVKIECQGYTPQTINNVLLSLEYNHLGNVKLYKA